MENPIALGIGIAGISAMVTVAAYGQMNTPFSNDGAKADTAVDANGNLHVPDAYRTTCQFSPGTIAGYRSDRHFPDGSVLAKEVFEAATGPMTTGTVSHAERLKGWFVMKRNDKDSHTGNKLWGDGWGWSWFDSDNPSKTRSTDCQPCHLPAKATDWIYVDGYAPLK